MPAKDTRRWSAREVRALIAKAPLASPRYELVDGELLATPSPGPPHQRAVKYLLIALDAYLTQQPVGEVLDSPSDIEVEADQVTQPDVFVLPPSESARLVHEPFPALALLLAIEVISPSSARFDRVKKRPLYQRNVPEYWLVDVDARLVERWRVGDERPEILVEELTWKPDGASSAFVLDLGSFFRRVWAEG
jgi:Uma2 family endonuclease